MTKRIRNILIGLCGMFALLFVGIFFVGCNVDYSLISLEAESTSVSVDVGEEVSVNVTIQGYQDGFSRRMRLTPQNDGNTSVFSYKEPIYISQNTFRVSIKGEAGGTGSLVIKTWEADKECVINVKVNQFTTSLQRGNQNLYVSNNTPYIPDAGQFLFDPNTTNTDLQYYYITPDTAPDANVNFNTASLEKLEVSEEETDGVATFIDRMGNRYTRNVYMVDKISLGKGSLNQLYRHLGDEVVQIPMAGQVKLLAVYKKSLSNGTASGGRTTYTNVINCVSSVSVLPNLDVKITGGYRMPNGSVDFGEIDQIRIVPNNTDMVEYLIRVEMNNLSLDDESSPIKLGLETSNNYAVVEYFYFDEWDVNRPNDAGKNVQYIKISQNSQTEQTTQLTLNIFYEVAEEIEDESVNVSLIQDIHIMIAPYAITVNGSTDPAKLTLYNFYLSPEFGWQDMFVNVISNYNTSPTFSGIYLEFDDALVDVKHGSQSVDSRSSYKPGDRLETDLSVAFQVRGINDVLENPDVVIKIHVVSDIIQNPDENNEITLDVHCEIVAGATRITSPLTTYYLDVDGGMQEFTAQLYADNRFQGISVRCISDLDTVSFAIDNQNPCLRVSSAGAFRYYLNLRVTPKASGPSTYTIVLDNGISVTVSFNCIGTLNPTSSPFGLTRSGNEDVTSVSYSKEFIGDAPAYDNRMDLEILNSSTKNGIEFGSVANIEFNGHFSQDSSAAVEGDSVSAIRIGSAYRITTRSNGDAKVTFTLYGYIISGFTRLENSLSVYVYVSSYSLVEEFYLKNGDNYALSNTVYYNTTGDIIQEGADTINFEVVVNHENSNNFYQYYFREEMIERIFNAATPEGRDSSQYMLDLGSVEEKGALQFDKVIGTRLVHEAYVQDTVVNGRKFIYFYAYSSSGRLKGSTLTNVRITRVDAQGETTRNITLTFVNGLMFYAENIQNYIVNDENGQWLATYSVEFSNYFEIDTWAKFDIGTFTYTNVADTTHTTILSANLRQRDLTRRYDAIITTKQYQSVTSVSLASAMDEVNFSNDKLEVKISVYTYPTNATNNDIRVQFITTNGNKYGNMLAWEVDDSQKSSGLFTITLSCKEFFDWANENLPNGVVGIDDVALTGRVYIYPSEWGRSYMAITNRRPIQIDVQFRNGSKLNPYILETADDVLAINANETKLKSHYEIKTVIDMSTVEKGALPIGILQNGDNLSIVGFSGSIVGTTSHSSITGVKVSDNNFSATVDGKTYSGLFGLINSAARIENLLVSGVFDNLSASGYVGLLVAENRGQLINVGANIEKSFEFDNGITAVGELRYGAVAGVNYGKISQDLTKFEGTGYYYRLFVDTTVGIGSTFTYKGNGKTYNVLNNVLVDENGIPVLVAGVGYIRLMATTIYTDDFGKYVYIGGNKEENIVRIDEFGFQLNIDEKRVKFDESGDVVVSSSEGLMPRNMAYYYDVLSITSTASASDVMYIGGVVGENGGIVERISASASYRLYGYAGYSAYTLINFYGNAREVAYIGGAIGALTYLQAFDGTVVEATNLLVGGEINVSGLTTDYLGGIVGMANTKNEGRIEIFNNTSRIFLRGGNGAVGGVLGLDNYASTQDSNNRVQLGTGNKIQAVDDGKNVFRSAMIVRYSSSNISTGNLPANNADEATQNLFFAIGYGNGRAYSGLGFAFEVVSYLLRTQVTVTLPSDVYTTSTSTKDFYGDYLIASPNPNGSYRLTNAYTFKHEDINPGKLNSNFKMTSESSGAPDLYFMYYFAVNGHVDGTVGSAAQDEIEELNIFSPQNEDFYPFVLENQEVNLQTTSTSVLSVDLNGNITTKGVGFANLTISSILNITQSRTIYIYVFNYFEKDFSASRTASMFYTVVDGSSGNLPSGSSLTIVGDSYTSLYLVPSYGLSETTTVNGRTFSISKDGILGYRNVDYTLADNKDMTIEEPKTDGTYFSDFDITNQNIVFWRDIKKSIENAPDKYRLVPVLRVEMRNPEDENKPFVYYYLMENAGIDLTVNYMDAATGISTQHAEHTLLTNGWFGDYVQIESTSKNELVFYQIFHNGELVQDRLPNSLGGMTFESWKQYIHFDGEDASQRLFNLQFTKNATIANRFDFVCEINKSSEIFNRRFDDDVDIYGDYTVWLYTSELARQGAVRWHFTITLVEAQLNYVSIVNYSNINDTFNSDDIVIPGSQRGMLEITLNPIEAVFERFTLRNSSVNSLAGASNASFMMMYRANEGTKDYFVEAPNFGQIVGGEFTFTYEQLIAFLKNNGSEFNVYSGKVYVAYFFPANNVRDGASVGFDVTVTCGAGRDDVFGHIDLTMKIANYARVTIDDKEVVGDHYYLARGLSYGMTLDYWGFPESGITVTANSDRVSITSLGGGKYGLQVTRQTIDYNNYEPGFEVEITTYAEKVVDGVTENYSSTIKIYLMEFVMNYNFQEGVNADIVRGMQNGVINDAIGNPYELRLSILSFMEYDSSISVVLEELETFVSQMTENVEWHVYLRDKATKLQKGRIIEDNDYYYINSLTVTPIRLYNPESNIYHFSVGGYYQISSGKYSYSSTLVNSNRLYTEFSFRVHEQSTQDSPIPVRSYEEFMTMADGGWYILLDNIVLPGQEYAVANGLEEFKPITAQIAGFDGNGYLLEYRGTYNFSGLRDAGVFANVASNALIQNVRIYCSSDVTFNMSASSFNFGLLAASNSGKITNCSVETKENCVVSVSSSATSNGSYVAALVAQNMGYITNSRSKVNMFSNFNLSGFVGTNSGLISSSYFLDGSLKNDTNTISEYTAGFVISNSGRIHTSYVSGKADKNSSFYRPSGSASDRENSITSSNSLAGFVFTNSGEIGDCYSNIRLLNGGFAAGFVYENSGTIERSFSTSILQSNQTASYGFARTNTMSQGGVVTGSAKIIDCFYLSDKDPNQDGDTSDAINVDIAELRTDDNTQIKVLSAAQLNINNLGDSKEDVEIKNLFDSYVIAQGRDYNSVWFFNDNPDLDNNFQGQFFNTGRIELVAPNIIAFSTRKFDHMESAVVNGVETTRYVYVYVDSSPALGSMFNPILISSAEEFETYIIRENNTAGYNYSTYRFIADISYANYVNNGSTYNTKFLGYLEGNFVNFTGISLRSSDSLRYAGLFAEIGSNTFLDAVGTVMNFTYSPNLVSFPNTNVAGAITGRLNNGTLLNVSVEKGTSQSTIVEASNIVGGAVGLAQSRFKMQNIYSQFGARARNQNTEGNIFNESTVVYGGYSFAGSIAGVLSGNGTVYNSVTDTASISAAGAKAGLMFGLIDKNVTVEKVLLEMSQSMSINGYNYAGLVAGESKGTVSDVTIKGTGASFTNVRKIPRNPTAFGGFAGIVGGGTITNIEMTQSMYLSSTSASAGIKYIGGIAGIVNGRTEMSDIRIGTYQRDVTLVGFEFVGGVVGSLSTVYMCTFEDVKVFASLEIEGTRQPEVAVGGLVGELVDGSMVNLRIARTDESNEKVAEWEDAIYELETKEGVEGSRPDATLNDLRAELAEINAALEALNEELNGLIEEDAEANEDKINEIRGKILVKESDLSDLSEKIEGIEKEIAGIKTQIAKYVDELDRNVFDIDVNINVYLYDTSITTYVGAVFGANKSSNVQSIYDTISRLKGGITVDDVSQNSDLMHTTDLKASQNEKGDIEFKSTPRGITEQDSIDAFNRLVDIRNVGATRSTYFCDLSYSTILRETWGEVTYILMVNNCGAPTLA